MINFLTKYCLIIKVLRKGSERPRNLVDSINNSEFC